jgi:guanosine-3',5'-bis(diphosphate) 3'-pyrophosphohydrolase
VKYADMIDNSNKIVKHNRDFARVFLHECRQLLEVMKAGDRQLYRLAVETVETGLRKLRELS